MVYVSQLNIKWGGGGGEDNVHTPGIHTGFSAKGGGGDRGVGSNCRVAFFRDLRKGY